MSIKKTVIAAAVAGVIAAPMAAQADVMIKGLISQSIDFIDQDGGAPNGSAGASISADGTQMNTNQSSIGFKWSEDLGNGNKVIGFVDFQYNPSEPSGSGGGGGSVGTRDQYVGFQGDWGKVVFGATSSSYKSSGSAIDPLWRTSMQARGNLDQISNLHAGATQTAGARGRVGDIIRYDSPNMNGFKAIGWVSIDDTAADDHGWGGGLHYKNGPLFAAIDYVQFNTIAGGDDDAFKVSAKYNFGQFAIWGAYENDGGAVSSAEGLAGTDGADIIYFAGSAKFDNNDVVISYGQRDDSNGVGIDDGKDAWGVTVRHHMSKRTYLYAGYGSDNQDAAGLDREFGTVGVRHKF